MDKYFCFCRYHGFNTFDTAERAKEFAEECLANEDALDDFDSVCWGEISQVTEEHDDYGYQLVDN